MIIYAHGLKHGQSKSAKGELLCRKLGACTPDLPANPKEAVTVLEDLILANTNVMLVGHSLGGFYAAYLANKHNIPVILTNPSVRPQDSPLLSSLAKGDETFQNALRAILTGYDTPIRNPDHFLVMLQKSDEVLEYREAFKHYQQCNLIVLNGGSHKWDDFEHFLPIVEYFYQLNFGANPHESN